jgi:hypothetical protein
MAFDPPTLAITVKDDAETVSTQSSAGDDTIGATPRETGRL